MDDLSRDWIRKQQALGDKISQYDAFEKFDAAELPTWSDKDLAGWQGLFPPGSPQYLLAEHEWQRRLSDRQIAATHKANLRSIIGGIVGTLIGVVVGWLLSSHQPQSSHQGRIPPVQTETHAPSQPAIQQPVAASQQTATPAPVQQPPNP